jgi:hypothetical protein
MPTACARFVGFGNHCHRCLMTWLMHEKGSARVRMTVGEYNRYCAAKPVLTVIDGGKDDDDACRWGAWIEGERS